MGMWQYRTYASEMQSNVLDLLRVARHRLLHHGTMYSYTDTLVNIQDSMCCQQLCLWQ